MRDGKPVVGFGFNSNGRYAPQGLLRERFIPRLKAAKPDEIVDARGPARSGEMLGRHDAQREAGRPRRALGRGRRARHGAVGRAWRRPKACRCGGCSPTATTAARPTTTAWVYAAGGYYYPDKDISALQDEMKRYLDLGYSTVKMKIGGVPLDDDLKRIEAALKVVGGKGENLCVDVNGRYRSRRGAGLRRRDRAL